MITRMTVDNFKAIRHVAVDLAPFTVFIGPNDTGKTSFLEAVYALAESTRSSLPECFWSPWRNRELVHKHAPDTPVRFTAELSASGANAGQANTDGGLVYSLAFDFNGERGCKVFAEQLGPSVDSMTELTARKLHGETAVCARDRIGYSTQPPNDEYLALRRVAEALPAAVLARWDVEELAMPSRLAENRRFPIDPSGYGLATCIAEIKLGQGAHVGSLTDDFCARFPTFQDVIIRRATV